MTGMVPMGWLTPDLGKQGSPLYWNLLGSVTRMQSLYSMERASDDCFAGLSLLDWMSDKPDSGQTPDALGCLAEGRKTLLFKSLSITWFLQGSVLALAKASTGSMRWQCFREHL